MTVSTSRLEASSVLHVMVLLTGISFKSLPESKASALPNGQPHINLVLSTKTWEYKIVRLLPWAGLESTEGLTARKSGVRKRLPPCGKASHISKLVALGRKPCWWKMAWV